MDRADLAASTAGKVGAGTFCANHPGRSTMLRCNRCDKLMCTKCAQRTPVGYRCGDCVRGQQAMFETVLWRDYLVAAVIALFLSGLAGVLLISLRWFVIFLAPMVGGVIAEVIRRAVNRRRGRYLAYAAVGAMVLASLPNILSLNLWSLIYLVLAGSTVYAKLSGTSI